MRRRGLRLCEPCDCFAYSVFEVAGLYRGGRGLTPFSLGKSRALWFCHALPRIFSLGDYSVSSLSVSLWKCLQAAPIGLLFQGVQGIRRPVFIYTGYPRCYSHSCKTHHPSLSMVINCDVVNKDQTFLTHISTPYPSFSCGPYFFVSFP